MIPGIGTLINGFGVIVSGILARIIFKKELKNFDENHESGWVTVPNSLWDNEKSRGLYQEYIDHLHRQICEQGLVRQAAQRPATDYPRGSGDCRCEDSSVQHRSDQQALRDLGKDRRRA